MIELAFHKVPLNQMNMTLTCNTFAIQSPIFVAVFCQNRLLWGTKMKTENPTLKQTFFFLNIYIAHGKILKLPFVFYYNFGKSKSNTASVQLKKMFLQCLPTWILALTATLANLGEVWAVRVEGKRFSVMVLDTKVLATGRFFFSDGSSLEPSAGLFTPPTEEKWNTVSVKPQFLSKDIWTMSSLGGHPLK